MAPDGAENIVLKKHPASKKEPAHSRHKTLVDWHFPTSDSSYPLNRVNDP